jgi:hypothetical protein
MCVYMWQNLRALRLTCGDVMKAVPVLLQEMKDLEDRCSATGQCSRYCSDTDSTVRFVILYVCMYVCMEMYVCVHILIFSSECM